MGCQPEKQCQRERGIPHARHLGWIWGLDLAKLAWMKIFVTAIPALLLACVPAGGMARAERTDAGMVERLTGWFSPEFRRDQRRLAAVNLELKSLPALVPQPFAWRYGFRSKTQLNPDVPQWLQIDLGGKRVIDRIVLVPAHIPPLGKQGAGYGFPLRFRIEVAMDADMRDAVTVVDQSAADFPNPGRYPADFRIPPVEGRHVRVTSTRHFPIDEGFIWALEELLVLSGNHSLATLRPVTTSSSLEMFPNWSAYRSQNGQSALGLPVTAEPSPTSGYLSATTDDPDELKWLHIDLGDEYRLDEVRLIPIQPGRYETLGERSFPRAWAVELAEDPAFERVVWRDERGPHNLVGYPGDCAVFAVIDGARGRYLRILALKHWGTGDRSGYGLAEIQAYSGDRNVALGRPVAASDEADGGTRWSPAFVTNGFSSRHRLIEIPDHLDLIARRAVLERERDSLVRKHTRRVRATGLVLGYKGGSLGGATLAGLCLLLLRQRVMRRRAVSRLRGQIARDLHDDIGSNLGGIVLISEVGMRQQGDPQVREDFRTIMEAAEGASQSMEEIIWLVEDGRDGLRDLIVRMRRSAGLILGENHRFLLEPEDFANRTVSLFFRRHFFFAFKETLHNARRHARASMVEVRVTVAGREVTFEVADDGIGFDAEGVAGKGHGLTNLRRRADRLGGACQIHSTPGKGTRVTFRADIKNSMTS